MACSLAVDVGCLFILVAFRCLVLHGMAEYCIGWYSIVWLFWCWYWVGKGGGLLWKRHGVGEHCYIDHVTALRTRGI